MFQELILIIRENMYFKTGIHINNSLRKYSRHNVVVFVCFTMYHDQEQSVSSNTFMNSNMYVIVVKCFSSTFTKLILLL